ncbi:hypothetical protein [Synechocystis salina]|uniref:Uncharacterized protein n=1 Tax=Synechocystis salina LEGE 00031 TaxID=1828736 RepID=A0ABR9VMX1_9SYNC|nr:hypothetical protein [Synechocystis salina]MBE9239660.1 hypothetical protein [Synechocystis salina LEGE 00041]MBE9252699.1 hypothetical protein [Synechocystis salina LEGE 00031]
MGLINRLGQAAKGSLQKYAEDYVTLNTADKQVILKPKIVSFLCQKATDKVEQLTNLEPDSTEGLIATVVHDKVTVKVKFTPDNLTIKGDLVEGQLRLLEDPKFETNSWVYRSLIAGWKVFLGGYIPNDKLPEGVRIEGKNIFYSFPKSQLKLVNLLFSSIKDGSCLDLNLLAGELIATANVAINWSDLNMQDLIKMFKPI